MRRGFECASRDTRAVHAGRHDLRDLGVHALPLDLSTTYPVCDLDGAGAQLDAWATGEQPAGSPIYARLHNPTVGRFEDAMAELEHAEAAVAFASGMGAITALPDVAPGRSRHVVAVRPLYGGTDHLLASELLGLDVTWATPDEVAGSLRPDTGLVLLETPQNPTTTLVDIAAIIAAAGGIPVAVDNTFATSVLQRPIELGASLVIHSATKFIGGHGDAMGGVIACDGAVRATAAAVRIATGALLHPMAAYHLHRGLPTLPIRVRAMQESRDRARQPAQLHPAVAARAAPRTASCSPDQMSGPGSMVAFELDGGFEAAAPCSAPCASPPTPSASARPTRSSSTRPRSRIASSTRPRAPRCGVSPGCCGSPSGSRTSRTSGPTSSRRSTASRRPFSPHPPRAHSSSPLRLASRVDTRYNSCSPMGSPRRHTALVLCAAAAASAASAPAGHAATIRRPPLTWLRGDGNYTKASRKPSAIRYVVVHATEGPFWGSVWWLKNRRSHASATYLVSREGQIIQLVHLSDIAWHTGNARYNRESVGIEEEGIVGDPAGFTTAEYRATARLAAWLARRSRIPIDRQHFIGHFEVPDPRHPGLFGGSDHHTDPGPTWHWARFMRLVRRYAFPPPPHLGALDDALRGQVVTGRPSWQVETTGPVSRVEFLVDRHPRSDRPRGAVPPSPAAAAGGRSASRTGSTR